MYIMIDKTNRKQYTYQGNYPGGFILNELKKGNDLIVISTYSNTIKIPKIEVDNGIEILGDGKEYPFPKELINPMFLE